MPSQRILLPRTPLPSGEGFTPSLRFWWGNPSKPILSISFGISCLKLACVSFFCSFPGFALPCLVLHFLALICFASLGYAFAFAFWKPRKAKEGPKGCQKNAKRGQRDAKGRPRARQGGQGEAKGGQREAKGRPRGGQGRPKGGPREAKGRPKEAISTRAEK